MPPVLRRSLASLRTASYWVQAQAIFAVLGVLKRLPAEAALNFVGRAARRIGPLLGRHRVALRNLELAMPEKSAAEREAIAGDMWENMARLAGEYVFLDQLFDYDPDGRGDSRIDVVGRDLFEQLYHDKRPKVFFTAHLGNFELLPICAATFGLPVTAMFRPPNNPFIAKRVLAARSTSMGHLVPSRAGAAITLARILEDGGNVGVLVDQKFANGLDTTFFNAPCQTNPLLARLVRQFDCDVYPAHCVRLPGGRFRLTLEPALDIPRDKATGQVDVHRLMQGINDRVEAWVRDDPGQWMWFHKRWNIVRTKPARKTGTSASA